MKVDNFSEAFAMDDTSVTFLLILGPLDKHAFKGVHRGENSSA